MIWHPKIAMTEMATSLGTLGLRLVLHALCLCFALLLHVKFSYVRVGWEYQKPYTRAEW